MPEHGVHYGQTVTSTEVQQQNTAWVQFRGAILSDNTPPGLTVAANVSIEVTQEDEVIPRRNTLQYPHPNAKGGSPLVHRSTQTYRR